MQRAKFGWFLQKTQLAAAFVWLGDGEINFVVTMDHSQTMIDFDCEVCDVWQYSRNLNFKSAS